MPRIVVTRPDGSPMKGVTVDVIGTNKVDDAGVPDPNGQFPRLGTGVTNQGGAVSIAASGSFFVRPHVSGDRHRVLVTGLDGTNCYDYVVDCDGEGTHETVREMMADFMAEAAAATNVMKTCLLCCDEDEDTNITISSANSSAGSATLVIEGRSGPRQYYEPAFPTERAALIGIINNANDAYFATLTSGNRYTPHFIFKNIRMANRTSGGAVPGVAHGFIYDASNAGHSGYDFFDCHFDIGLTSNTNGVIVRAEAASVGDKIGVRFYRCEGTAGALHTHSGAVAASNHGTLEIFDCVFSLRHVLQGSDSFGLDLLRIVGGGITVSDYFYERTNGGGIDIELRDCTLVNTGATTAFRLSTLTSAGVLRFMAFDVHYVQTNNSAAVGFANLSAITGGAGDVDTVFIDGLYARMSASLLNAGTMLTLASWNHIYLGMIAAQGWTTPVSGGTPVAAPSDAQYLTLAAAGGLTSERVFTPRYNLFAIDGGAGLPYTVDSWLEGAVRTPSAGSLTLGTDGDMFHVAAGNFSTIATPTRQQLVLLVYDGVSVITHGTGANAVILQGATNWTTAAGDSQLLMWEGTNWREVNRQLATPAAGTLRVKEVDGAPDVSGVSIIQVSNGTLVDNGGGDVTITTGGGGGGGHLIRENGVDQTPRANLNFVDPDAGAGLVVDDAGAALETEIHLDLYRLESENHDHSAAGLQGGILDPADIPLADAGGFFTVDNIEAALQELGLAGTIDPFRIIDLGGDTYVRTESTSGGNEDVIESASAGTIRSRLSALGLQLANGTDLLLYSDNFTSLVASIDAATGNANLAKVTVDNAGLTVDDEFFLNAIGVTRPGITFDSGDRISYDRTNNRFEFALAGTEQWREEYTTADALFSKLGTGNHQVRFEAPDITTEDYEVRIGRTTVTTGAISFAVYNADGLNNSIFNAARTSAGLVRMFTTGYARIGSSSVPTNTTPGDHTAQRLIVPNAALADSDLITQLGGPVGIRSLGVLRFYDATNTDYVGIRAPTTPQTEQYIYVLPDDDPAAGEVLAIKSIAASPIITTEWAPAGSGHTIHDEAAAALTTRAALHVIGDGIAALDNAGSSRTEIHHAGHLIDAVVDNLNTLSKDVPGTNVYSTIALAVASGAVVIGVRNAADSADIVIDSGDSCTVLIGMSTSATVVPVNIHCTKDNMLFQNLWFNATCLFLEGLQNRAFSCLFTGSITLGTCRVDDAGGVTTTDTSIPFDTVLNGGLGYLTQNGGYAQIRDTGTAGVEEIFSYTSDASAGTPLNGVNKGFFFNLRQAYPDAALITDMARGSLYINTNAEITACFFINLSNPLASACFIGELGARSRITACVFNNCSTFADISMAPFTSAVNAPIGVEIVGTKFNHDVGFENRKGIIVQWYGAGTAQTQPGIYATKINGCSMRGFNGVALHMHMARGNVAGNSLDGGLGNAAATDAYQCNGAITNSQVTIPYNVKTGTGTMPYMGFVRLASGEEVAYASSDATNLYGCVRGFNGTVAAAQGAGSAITPLNQICIHQMQGINAVATQANLYSGNSFGSARVGNYNTTVTFIGGAAIEVPMLLTDNIYANVTTFYGGTKVSFLNNANGTMTYDMRNIAQNLMGGGGGNGSAISLANVADGLLMLPQAAVTGVPAPYRFPSDKMVQFGYVAGSKSPLVIPLTNRTSAVSVAGHVASIPGTSPNVTFDAASNNSVSAAGSSTHAHTVAVQNNRLLIVTVAQRNNTTGITSVTYGGVGMNQVGSVINNTTPNPDVSVSMWYLLAPATGANNVVVTFAGTTTDATIGASSYYNCRQQAPTGVQSTTGNGTAPSIAVVSSAAIGSFGQDMVVDVVACTGTPAKTVGAGQTSNHNTTNTTISTGSSRENGAASVTMSWSWVGNQDYAQLGASLEAEQDFDFGWINNPGAAADSVAGVCVEGSVAVGAATAIAIGGVCDVLCNGTVNRNGLLEMSATAGEAREATAPGVNGSVFAKALQGRRGAGSSLVRCILLQG